jgi:hypothetical protein
MLKKKPNWQQSGTRLESPTVKKKKIAEAKEYMRKGNSPAKTVLILLEEYDNYNSAVNSVLSADKRLSRSKLKTEVDKIY